MHFSGSSGGFQGGHKKPCRDFSATGMCKWGQNCRYAHDIRPGGQELGGPSQQIPHQQHPQAAVYKTKLCPQYLSGQCRYGAHCKFAHGEHELHNFQGFDNPSQAPMQQQQPGLQKKQQQQQQQYQQPPRPDSVERQTPTAPQQLESQSSYSLPPQQQQRQQQQRQQQQQQAMQQAVVGGPARQRQGGVTYLDRVRAMCKALAIGDVGDLVSDEAMAAAVAAFQRGLVFKENRFADGVEKYLPPM